MFGLKLAPVYGSEPPEPSFLHVLVPLRLCQLVGHGGGQADEDDVEGEGEDVHLVLDWV